MLLPTISFDVCGRQLFREKMMSIPREAACYIQEWRLIMKITLPIRRFVLHRRADSLACGHFEIGKPKSSLSHHFRVLRESGVIATRREGTALLNSLRRQDLDSRFPGLLKAVLGRGSKRGRNTRS